jgi:hypothetical protein
MFENALSCEERSMNPLSEAFCLSRRKRADLSATRALPRLERTTSTSCSNVLAPFSSSQRRSAEAQSSCVTPAVLIVLSFKLCHSCFGRSLLQDEKPSSAAVTIGSRKSPRPNCAARRTRRRLARLWCPRDAKRRRTTVVSPHRESVQRNLGECITVWRSKSNSTWLTRLVPPAEIRDQQYAAERRDEGERESRSQKYRPFLLDKDAYVRNNGNERKHRVRLAWVFRAGVADVSASPVSSPRVREISCQNNRPTKQSASCLSARQQCWRGSDASPEDPVAFVARSFVCLASNLHTAYRLTFLFFATAFWFDISPRSPLYF